MADHVDPPDRAAAGLLVLRILPGQDGALTAVQADDDTVTAPAVAARLAMLTGVFNLLWAVVTVLMIIRPGSTTGA